MQHLVVASTKSDLLFFTNTGKVYRVRTHEVPDASRQSKGIPVVNLIDIEQDLDQTETWSSLPGNERSDQSGPGVTKISRILCGRTSGQARRCDTRGIAQVSTGRRSEGHGNAQQNHTGKDEHHTYRKTEGDVTFSKLATLDSPQASPIAHF